MKQHILLFIVFLALMLPFLSCQKEEETPKTPKVTEKSLEVFDITATFSWTVDWLGKFVSVVEVSENEDMSDSHTFGSEVETNDPNYTVTATGLKISTRYYYQYLVWNKFYEGDKFKTNVKSFTTSNEGHAMVTTDIVSEVGNSGALCGGKVTNDGGHTVTERGVCWSTSHNPDIYGSHVSSGSGTGSFTCSISNLEPVTRYYVRAYAINSFGTNYGSEVSFVTAGAINGLFSVSDSEQVFFSQGNLQYIGSTDTWKFADHQWDVIDNDQSNNSQSATRDLFGWGTSGWDCGNTYYHPYYHPYDTDKGGYSYGPYGSYNLTGEYANSDWGVYNAISNGGNQVGLWRTLTKDEWEYLFNTREGSWLNGVGSARYAKAMVNNMTGVILFPDNYFHPSGVPEPNNINKKDASYTSNSYSGGKWNQMEQAGCVFLPAAGFRNGTIVNNVRESGYYWSSSYSDGQNAFMAYFTNDCLYLTFDIERYYGISVRLVRSAQ